MAPIKAYFVVQYTPKGASAREYFVSLLPKFSGKKNAFTPPCPFFSFSPRVPLTFPSPIPHSFPIVLSLSHLNFIN